MAEESAVEFAMPGSSWEMLKRIIKAYYAAQESKEVTVEAVAKLSGILRPVISSNNNFLRSIGLVEKGRYKLTPIGVRLAMGFSRNNASVITGALNEIIDNTDKLKQIVRTVQARGTMDEDAFRVEMMLMLGLSEKSPGLSRLRTVMDLLYESKILILDEGKVSFHRFYVGDIEAAADLEAVKSYTVPSNVDGANQQKAAPQPERSDSQTIRDETKNVPIALGPKRRAYLELPNDWKPNDLKKLLKMIELALGEEEGTQ
jgi:hypothetical protein